MLSPFTNEELRLVEALGPADSITEESKQKARQKSGGLCLCASSRGEVNTTVCGGGIPSVYYQVEGSKMIAMMDIGNASRCIEESLGLFVSNAQCSGLIDGWTELW